jgi:GNAT superfamily N-acetyltransferase
VGTATANTRIIPLADAVELIPVLAGWVRDDWPIPQGSAPTEPVADPEADFRGCARKSGLPMNFVALDRGVPVGTVFLLDKVPRETATADPWIEGLYVVPTYRHRGIALALVAAATEAAGAFGYGLVYIGVRGARSVYHARGWRFECHLAHEGEAIEVLSRSTAPTAR